jgi:PAS domain S-box-containing protein
MNIENQVVDADQPEVRIDPHLQATLNLIPAHTWCAVASGALTFANRSASDYLGLPDGHPLRLGIISGAAWDSHIPLLHPEDHDEARSIWSTCLGTGCAGQMSFRLRSGQGVYRWFLTRAEPVRANDGTLLHWVGVNLDIDDTKRAEDSLARSEMELRRVIDAIPVIAWCNLPDGPIEFLSKRWHEYTGLSEEESKGWGWHSAFHPDDLRPLMDIWQKHLASGESSAIEARIRSKHGVFRWFLIRSEALRDEVGNIKRWYGTSTDIDDRKRAEEAAGRLFSELQEREGRIRRLVDANIIGVLVSNSDSQIIECNDAFLKMVGYTREELIDGRLRWRAMTPPEWKDASDDGVRQTTTTGICRVFEKEYYRKDGSRVPVLVGAARYEKDSIVAFTIDLTELKRSEEALRRSEAFLAEGQRLSHTGSWGWKASTGKVMWSRELFRILGFDPKYIDPSLDVFWERVHPADRAGSQHEFETAIREKRNFEQEFRILTPDRSIRYLHAVGHAVLDETNELVEFIGTAMDTTERKHAEGRAQSQREAIRLALNAFIEKLDANRLLEDIVAETTKRFSPNSWELWLFDEAVGAFLLHSSRKSGESLKSETDRKIVRPLEELRGVWQSRNAGRAPQIFQLSLKNPVLGARWIKSLKARGIKTLMLVPLVLGEQNLGLVELHFESSVHFTSEDLELAQSLGNHATLALQLNRLTSRGEQLAVTEERNRMAREIHDTMAQAFAGIVLHSEALGASLGVSKRRSRIALSQVQKLARSGLDEARRSVQALRPKALEGSTLSQALEQVGSNIASRAKLSFHFRQRGEPKILHREMQNELFRIAQEALTNVAKHAQATSVWINLTYSAQQVSLKIRDDGVGLAMTASRKSNGTYGLASMRERAQRISGQLQIKRQKSGGTSIHVQVPLAENT